MISFGPTIAGSELTVGDTLTSDEVAGIKAANTPLAAGNSVIDYTTLLQIVQILSQGFIIPQTSISAMEATGSALTEDGLWYCVETETFYRYESAASAYTIDHLYVCSTPSGGDTRFLAVAGRYIVDGTQTKTIITASSGNLSVAQCRNTIITNYGQVENNTQNLPTAEDGLAFVVLSTASGVGYFNFKSGTNDKIYLNGIAGSDNGTIGLATPASGDSARFLCSQTTVSGYDWFVDTGIGIWAAV